MFSWGKKNSSSSIGNCRTTANIGNSGGIGRQLQMPLGSLGQKTPSATFPTFYEARLFR
jgi:hypothetical protein